MQLLSFDSMVRHLSGRQLPTTSQLLEGSRVATCSTMMNVQKEIPNSGFLWIPRIAHFPASKKNICCVSWCVGSEAQTTNWFDVISSTRIYSDSNISPASILPKCIPYPRIFSSRFNNKKPFGITSFFWIFEITTIWQLPRKAEELAPQKKLRWVQQVLAHHGLPHLKFWSFAQHLGQPWVWDSEWENVFESSRRNKIQEDSHKQLYHYLGILHPFTCLIIFVHHQEWLNQTLCDSQRFEPFSGAKLSVALSSSWFLNNLRISEFVEPTDLKSLAFWFIDIHTSVVILWPICDRHVVGKTRKNNQASMASKSAVSDSVCRGPAPRRTSLANQRSSG